MVHRMSEDMKTSADVVVTGTATPQPRMSPFVRRFKRDWQLHLLILLPIIWLLIFKYYPMYGAQIAFRNYRARAGIWGSPWVGLKWFKKFFNSPDFLQILGNTIILAAYSLFITFPLPIMFALMLNVLRNEKFKKFTQTVTYIPHFISVVVLVAILWQVFSPVNGLYGALFRLLGGEGYPSDIRSNASAFRHLYVWSAVWQNLGWSSIIYLASLSSVSNDLHEAAQLDGASRWKRVVHVDLPTIIPTLGIMLILRCGHILSIGFEKVFLMQNSLNLTKSEVISTYVYKHGLQGNADFSFGTAVDLFNSVVNCFMLLAVNWISKKASDDEVSLF